MKYTNLKLFEKVLQDKSVVSKVYLVIMPSDDERTQVFQEIIEKKGSQDRVIEKFTSVNEFRDIADSLLTESLFGSVSIVICDECESFKKKEVDLWSSFLESQEIPGLFILGSRGKTPLAKIVEKKGVVLDMGDEKPWDKEKRLHESLSMLVKSSGKWISPDAVFLLVERIGPDFAALCQEVEKILCFIGDRPTIERSDIFRLSCVNQLDTPWQMAEDIVWEGHCVFDPAVFPSLIFALRSQLQIGLKITALVQDEVPFSEWSSYFPKVWPRTLEKRKQQAMQKGAAFFQKGLKVLFKIESLSRNGVSDASALFDLFRVSLLS